jgi:hypothetical protein
MGHGGYYIVAWKPGGPRSRGAGGVCGAEDSAVRAEIAAEVGVKVESTGLACWAWDDGGALRADEMKEEEEPDRQDEAMVVVVAGRGVALVRMPDTPPFCVSCCVTRTGTRRATERRLSGGCSRCSR